MAQHGVDHPNFKGFMANSTKVNWNAICVIYSSGSANEKIENRERFVALEFFSSEVHIEVHQGGIPTTTYYFV